MVNEYLVPQDHPALHQVAKEVPKDMFGTKELNDVIDVMRKGLRAYDVEGYVGVAIAAPQVGESWRIFIVEDQNPSRKDEEQIPTLIAINPTIKRFSKKKEVLGEGCLSVPNHYGAVERATNVTLEAYDENGTKFTRGAGGFLAQIFQHEVQHLDGLLFVDVATKIWDKEELKKQQAQESHEQS